MSWLKSVPSSGPVKVIRSSMVFSGLVTGCVVRRLLEGVR